MANLRVTPAQKEHLSQVAGNRDWGTLPEVLPKPMYTFLVDDKPVAILGGVPVIPGVMTFWAYLTDEIKKFPLFLHKNTKRLIEEQAKEFNLRRAQMTVQLGHLKGHAWAVSLGFTCEGVMQNYGPDGTPHWLFGRVF